MSEKYELGNAIAQVQKYKRKMDKAKGAKKMICWALLAFWKEMAAVHECISAAFSTHSRDWHGIDAQGGKITKLTKN